jgi:hypothetical protein
MDIDSGRIESPVWDDLLKEDGADPTVQNTPTEDVIQADQSKGEEVREKLTEETSEVMAVGQSERIKKQGPEGIKIAEKAEIAIKKKNLDSEIDIWNYAMHSSIATGVYI